MEKRILCAGTFDKFHTGHVSYLKKAKALADKSHLIVIVARDSTSLRIKKKKTINNENSRLKRIKDLEFVDEAVLGFKKNKIIERIVSLKPDVIALGFDQWAKEDWLSNELSKKGLKVKISRMSQHKKEFL